jgi:hypothetical protein
VSARRLSVQHFLEAVLVRTDDLTVGELVNMDRHTRDVSLFQQSYIAVKFL